MKKFRLKIIHRKYSTVYIVQIRRGIKWHNITGEYSSMETAESLLKEAMETWHEYKYY